MAAVCYRHPLPGRAARAGWSQGPGRAVTGTGRGPAWGGAGTPIRIATNTALAPIKTGSRPYAIAIAPR